MPAICSSFLGTGADTMPVPWGAGMSLTQMEPHLPVTLVSGHLTYTLSVAEAEST